MPLILASASPRRRMLLQSVGIPIDAVRPPDVVEVPEPDEAPEDYVRRLARAKAEAVPAPGAWVLAADTVVHAEGRIFEKPQDAEDAVRMLMALSARWHRVSTGWCLGWGGGQQDAAAPARLSVCTSLVRFRKLSEAEATAYVRTGESLDKAGAYGIQGAGAALVAEVQGSHSNVVGLPMEEVLAALDAVGIHPQVPGARQ